MPGISGFNQLGPSSPLYSDARKIMTKIIEVVVNELRSNGFSDVLVADSHGLMNNIIYADLKVSASILQGFPRPYSMVLGVEGYDAAFFIGYHAAVGTTGAYLSHTMSLAFHRILINGELASEYYLNALYAGMHGVPVALVAGDEGLRDDVRRHTPWTVFVPLKKGISWLSEVSPSINEVISRLRRGIAEACNKVRNGEVKPLTIESPINVEVEVRRELIAELAELIPGAVRKDVFRIEYRASSPADALKFIELVAIVGKAASSLLRQ